MKFLNLTILAAFLSLQAICRADCSEGRAACLENCNDACGSGAGAKACLVGCNGNCSGRCFTPRGGCHNGYCWAACSSWTPFGFDKEWCYTTRGSSQDYNYITCSNDSECDWNWRCAGSCTL